MTIYLVRVARRPMLLFYDLTRCCTGRICHDLVENGLSCIELSNSMADAPHHLSRHDSPGNTPTGQGNAQEIQV